MDELYSGPGASDLASPQMVFGPRSSKVGPGTGDPEAIWQAMLKQESGNRQFGPDGKPLHSPAGAVGIAQVMPGTGPEAAKLAGVPWDPQKFENDPTYNASLGKAYYLNLVGKYKDPYLAAAGYNAGPGRLDQALAQASGSGGSALDYLPAETQNYYAMLGGPLKAQLTSQVPASLTGAGAIAVPPMPPGTANPFYGKPPAQEAAPRQGLDPLAAMRLIQALVPPTHKLESVSYDPWKLVPKTSGTGVG